LINRFCIQTITVLVVCFLPLLISAQSLYIRQGTKEQLFIERLEILSQKNNDLNIYTPGSIPRPLVVPIAGLEDSSSGKPYIKLSRTDQQNLLSLLRNNAEYVTWGINRNRILYNNRANFIEVNKENFFLSINPVILAMQSYESGNSKPVYHFAGGANLRGLIGKKFGFYSYVTKHAESVPLFLQQRIVEFNAVPGAGKFETYKKGRGYVYFDTRGGINFNASKNFNIEVAFDRNFLGNGYRSLILSDYGYNYLYLKANTYFGKFKYEHIYAKLANPFSAAESNEKWPYGEKVMFMHHLSINATKWLNLGIYQALIANEKTKWNYINPIMFFPRSEHQRNNPPDNDLQAIDFKANVAKRAQFYGQLMMDNFSLKQVTKGNGWWNNRYGVQLGAKYINLFKVNNLDFQIEMNIVRPYTYSSKDSIGNYSHYNQPLAHPLGADFREWVGILRYQPSKKITLSVRTFIWKQGLDTTKSENFGSDIFKGYETRPDEFGFTIPSGFKSSAVNAQFILNYEVVQNIFLDAGILLRNISVENNVIPERNTTMYTVGLRMNVFNREYDF
jgi:hypothetical protein